MYDKFYAKVKAINGHNSPITFTVTSNQATNYKTEKKKVMPNIFNKIGDKIMKFFKEFIETSMELYSDVKIEDAKHAARYVRNFYAELVIKLLVLGASLTLSLILPAANGRILTVLCFIPANIAITIATILQVISIYAKYMAPVNRFKNHDGFFT